MQFLVRNRTIVDLTFLSEYTIFKFPQFLEIWCWDEGVCVCDSDGWIGGAANSEIECRDRFLEKGRK